MFRRRRIHPERVFMVLIASFGLTTYTLFATGYFFNLPGIYRWAWIAGAITVVVGCTPLLAFLIGEVIAKLRGKRHD